MDCRNPSVRDSKASNLDIAVERCAIPFRLSRHRFSRPRRLRLDVGRNIQRTQNAVGQHRNPAARLVGAEQMGLHAPTHAIPGLELQVRETLLRPSHFKATHTLGARLAIEFQLAPKLNRIARKARHGLRRIELENEARSVRGRAAGLKQRPLLDDNNIPPAEFRQMIRDAATYDACANDDAPSLLRQCGIRHLLCLLSQLIDYDTAFPSDIHRRRPIVANALPPGDIATPEAIGMRIQLQRTVRKRQRHPLVSPMG